MTSETRYRPHPARSFSRAIHALLVVCALVAPSALWAQAPNCNPGETVTQIVEFTKKRIDSSDSIGPLYELQGWFEFDPIPEVAQYRLDITEFSINTSPPTLGRRFFYNTTNPPTRVDVYSLHRTSAGTLGVIVIHASGRPPSNAPAFWAGITGKAELTYTCPTPKIDIDVLATSTLTGSGDNLKATFTATLTNKGTSDATDVTLEFVIPKELNAQTVSDSRCLTPTGGGAPPTVSTLFAGVLVRCTGLSVAGGGVEFIELKTRVVNASDLKDRVTMTATVAGDIDNSNNEDTAEVTPSLSGTVADTLHEMAALDAIFNYRSPDELLGRQCNIYMDDIYSRLQTLHRANPSLFSNLSYGKITSGHYVIAGLHESDGHVGVVVYVKGSDYHKAGVVIHGTPTQSPADYDLESRRGLDGFGEHVTSLGFYANLNPFNQGTQDHGWYYRTPIRNFPGAPKVEGTAGCGFEGVYPDNEGEFSPFNAGRMPNCGGSAAAAPRSCPVITDPVIVRTESPVDLVITNSRAQRVETNGGQIKVQELPDGIASYPTQHEDGTFGWLMVLPKDNYDIKLVGTGQGPYKLTTVNYEDDGQANTTVYEGTTQLGQADDYKVAAPVPAVTVTAPPPSQTSNGNGKGGSGATTPGLLVSLLLLLLAQRRLRAANKTATAAI